MQSLVQLIILFAAIAVCFLLQDYCISCFVFGGCAVVFFIMNFIFWRYREKQLEEIIRYLMRVQDGLQLPELTKCNEGQAGILQSEIYKLVTLLQERSHAASKEKDYLAGMLSDISHQVKTPLAAITLLTDLLMKPGLPEEKRLEFAGKIEKQVSRITWLIRNLLTLSQLEADMLKLKREQVAVADLIEKACQPLELLAEVKGVAIVTDSRCRDGSVSHSGWEEMFLICDAAWTGEALSNIVKNCIEHTEEGGQVQITVSQHNFATDIVIRDTGCGIAKEDLPHVFERFYKGKHGSKDSVGIGLAMARQIIFRQNGVISVDSQEGVGTVFLIKMYSGIVI